MRIFILGTSEALWLAARHIHLTGCGEIAGVLTRKSSPLSVRTESDFKSMAREFSAEFFIREGLDHKTREEIKKIGADLCIALCWPGSLMEAASLFRLGAVSAAFGTDALQSGSDLDIWGILGGSPELNLSVQYVSPEDGRTRKLPVEAILGLNNDATIADIRRFHETRLPTLFCEAIAMVSSPAFSAKDVPALDTAGRSHFLPIENRDRRIVWSDSAVNIHAKIRAFTRPLFGAYTYMRDPGGRIIRLHIWKSRLAMNRQKEIGRYGQVSHCDPDSGEALVVTGDGILALQTVSEDADGPWFEPGKYWVNNSINLGLSLEDEVFALISRGTMFR
jgi:Methionyl-tRNA formyltransferase